MNKTIPILGIAVLVAVSFMVIVYFEPESFGLTRPYAKIGEYDGTASKIALMINEQCLDQEENPFKDYAFARTSNGEYYIDNVICERINIHQGGCLEPFSKGYPDETCKNRVTFDFPYGEKSTPINKEFCNQVESERSPDDSEHNKIMIDEYVDICTIRGLIDVGHKTLHIDVNHGAPSVYLDPTYISSANNQFAMNFYLQLSESDKNIFFSPWSISTAFAIVNEGAKGSTSEQFNDVFGFSDNPIQRQNEFKLANDNLNQPNKEYALSVANALWLAMDFTAKPEYVDVAQTYYDSKVESVDFKTDGIDVINSWVENQTQGKIKDLFEPDSLDGALFAITNAIYFKGTWVTQFDPDRTRVSDFWIAEESSVSVPMMFLPESKQKVAFLEEVNMIEIPYEGDKISMLVLLPSQRYELDKLESILDAEKISQWRQLMHEKSMAVVMPKFKIETDYNMIPHLHALGITHAFGGNADFGGITDSNLFIGEAVHKAFVEVNEEGAEAAAATGIGGFQSGPPTFEIDQPFIFLIQDKESESILFMGRMINPSA